MLQMAKIIPAFFIWLCSTPRRHLPLLHPCIQQRTFGLFPCLGCCEKYCCGRRERCSAVFYKHLKYFEYIRAGCLMIILWLDTGSPSQCDIPLLCILTMCSFLCGRVRPTTETFGENYSDSFIIMIFNVLF